MVHRLQTRNTGYPANSASTIASNQATLSATEGATALDLNSVAEEKTNIQEVSKTEERKQEEIRNETTQDNSQDLALENVSMESAAYLQTTENLIEDANSDSNENMDRFEVDSIELVTPDLFSENSEDKSFNKEINQEKEPVIFENTTPEENTEVKEQEMFKEDNLEEDFEIPAFLRRQKD